MRKIWKPRNRGKESPNYSLYFSERGEVLRVSLGTSDRAHAEELADEEIRKWRIQRLAAAYDIEAPDQAEERAPEELIVEYLQLLQIRGTSDKHRADVQRNLGRMFDLMGARSLGEVTPDRIRLALGKIQATNLTRNKNRVDLKSFFRWLVREERWHRNPVDAVPPLREVPERERRSLSIEELLKLLTVVPRHRALTYRVAACTGLRRNELDTLTWNMVNLERRTVGVLVKRAKSRKSAILSIDKETAALWQQFKDQKKGFHEGNWRGPEMIAWPKRIKAGLALPPIPPVKTFYRDLARIGVLKTDEKGEPIQDPDYRLDLHALRVTYGTSLARAGVSLTSAQKLMRHSDPRLTANVYTKLEDEDGRLAVDALGEMLDQAARALPAKKAGKGRAGGKSKKGKRGKRPRPASGA